LIPSGAGRPYREILIDEGAEQSPTLGRITGINAGFCTWDSVILDV